MKKSIGISLMTAGLLLLSLAMGLAVRNEMEVKAGGEQAEQALAQMYTKTRQRTEGAETEPSAPMSLPGPAKELPVVEISGYGYIGHLSIPSLERELPVMDHWSYPRLQKAPCRQLGTTAEQMVIAGHNYPTHFGGLRDLQPGDPLIFTDMDGDTTHYTVQTVRVIEPEDSGLLTEGSWDLILYTCTYGGKHRIFVGCGLTVS